MKSVQRFVCSFFLQDIQLNGLGLQPEHCIIDIDNQEDCAFIVPLEGARWVLLFMGTCLKRTCIKQRNNASRKVAFYSSFKQTQKYLFSKDNIPPFSTVLLPIIFCRVNLNIFYLEKVTDSFCPLFLLFCPM